MEKYWVCPFCLSTNVVKRWETQINNYGEVVNTSEQLEDQEFYCRSCDNSFDHFEPRGDSHDYRSYKNKFIIPTEILKK